MAGTNTKSGYEYSIDDMHIFDCSDSIEGDSAPLRRDRIFKLQSAEDDRGPSSSHSTSKQYSYCGSVDSGLGSTTKSVVSSSATLPSVTGHVESGLESTTKSTVSSTATFPSGLSSTHYSAQSSGYDSIYTTSSDISRDSGEELLLSKQLERNLKLGNSENDRNQRVPDDKHLKEIPQPEKYSDGFQLTEEALKINEDGDMSLHLAIIFLEVEVALILISLFPSDSINHANKLRQTPLHLSVLTRQPRITRALVLAGANLEIPDRNGNTALHLACSNNYLDCVGALTHPPTIKEVTDYLGGATQLSSLRIPQSLEQKNYEGYSCIHIATFNTNTQLLSYLVQHGANVNAAEDKSGRRPIHYAVESNNEELASLLVRQLGADVNSTTFDLNTPLHLATGRDFHRLVYLLMDCGASRQAVNSEGLRPYQMAKSDDLRRLLQVVEYSDFSIAGM